jgi:hypothetical protein
VARRIFVFFEQVRLVFVLLVHVFVARRVWGLAERVFRLAAPGFVVAVLRGAGRF